MPWNSRSVNQMREEFARRALKKEKSMAALCREYGISRPTGYKWLDRYRDGLKLADQSRRPATIHRVSQEMERLVVDLRRDYPAIGAAKLHRMLENEGHTDLPCVKTINNILKRNGLISKEASLAATPFQHFEKDEPNEMWQADYKGYFTMANGRRCFPLNIVDDCSRFNLSCEPMASETYEEIKPALTRVFQTYGLPRIFLCDNGNPWGTAQSTGFTRFEVWLMDLSILTIHGRALHPQTQGKEESFNRALTRELLKWTTILDEQDAKRKFDDYRNFYNNVRPHHALALDTPSQHYRKSERQYTDTVSPWEYPSGYELRRVKSTGFFNWDGQGYFLSEAFGEKEIAIGPSRNPACINLYYRQFHIGRIDKEKQVYTFKKAYLIDGDPRGESVVDGRRKK